MKRIGRTPQDFLSYNTCQHNGRVFEFSERRNKLAVIEILLGHKAELVTLETGVDCKTDNNLFVSCCSLGQRILVTSGTDDAFAALVDVGDGALSESTLCITTLAVGGDVKWPIAPYLCPVAKDQVLLYFSWGDGMWYGYITDTSLIMKKCRTTMPTTWGFMTVPIRLPDGKLLVAGLLPRSTDITLITTNGEPTFEKVGDIPGEARFRTSTVLVGDRFVVGFGGLGDEHLDDLWIFDLQTRQSSRMRQGKNWPLKDHQVPLIVQGDTLYFLGGNDSRVITSIRLSSLVNLIMKKGIKRDFRVLLGLAVAPIISYTKSVSLFPLAFAL